MDVLCERCLSRIRPHEEFVRLGHIYDVRDDGEPVYRFAYLHRYDADTDGCAPTAAAA